MPINLSTKSFVECNMPAIRINALAKVLGAQTYLEIGVRSGTTFFEVDIKNKFAVDPKFMFDTNAYAKDGHLHFFAVTSDEFFSLIGASKHRNLFFDIIFIDGLHTFEQSFTDFKNSLPFAHDKTVWIVDDTIPSSPYSAMPVMEDAFSLYQRLGYKKRPWHGDVFKTMFALHDFYLEYSFCSLLEKSQSVIWKTPEPSSRKPVFGSLEAIAALSYFDVLRHAKLFRPVPEHMMLSTVGTSAEFSYGPTLWESFVRKVNKEDFAD
jgi:hypothetical protein